MAKATQTTKPAAKEHTRLGFPGFRKPEKIDDKTLTEALVKMDTENLYVMWTGGAYRARKASLRSNALKTITEKMKPVPISELLTRAARAAGKDTGFDPYVVKGGLALHQGAKPAVFLYLRKEEDGTFTAVKDIPASDIGTFKAGEVVVGTKAKASKAKAKA